MISSSKSCKYCSIISNIISDRRFYNWNLVNSLLTIRFYMKAARIVKPSEPLQIQELQTPTTGVCTQVLIKVQSSGVCHSDVHVWEGYYEGIEGQPLKTTDRGVKYPLTPGHEIAGTVDGLGEQVEGFSKNEKVLVYPWIGEGLCPACRIGEENLCDKPRSLGIYTNRFRLDQATEALTMLTKGKIIGRGVINP
jgi:D-arabinose 1-dehydrogenase-like Zn-dependent alcohol dehydrogenase